MTANKFIALAKLAIADVNRTVNKRETKTLESSLPNNVQDGTVSEHGSGVTVNFNTRSGYYVVVVRRADGNLQFSKQYDMNGVKIGNICFAIVNTVKEATKA